MGKILVFEGAGNVERGDVENCRIRTRIKNNNGRIIYLEMHGIEESKYNKLPYSVTGNINHCYYTDREEDASRHYSRDLAQYEGLRFEYTKESILEFVNEKLNCSYTNLKVINDGLRVHDTTEALC